MSETREPSRRTRWVRGAAPGASGWLTLSDDELLHGIQALAPGHDQDDRLLEVVGSNRHFFIRQEAAKKVVDSERLLAFSADRHVGQMMVRSMTRAEDVEYLERLRDESRHLEVRKAAEAQLAALRAGKE
jgi:hypothetical protein